MSGPGHTTRSAAPLTDRAGRWAAGGAPTVAARPDPGSASGDRHDDTVRAGRGTPACRTVLPARHHGARPAQRGAEGRPPGRLLPGPVEPRQGRQLHPRRQLHRFVPLEGVRQGRHHHLGDPGDRLPLGRPGPPRVRAPRLPARRRLRLVHLLADPGALSVRARGAAGAVPGGAGAAARPGAGLGGHPGGPGAPAALPAGAGQGRAGARLLGRGDRDHRRRPCAHHRNVRARPRRGLLPHPGHVDGLARRRCPLHEPHRRADALLLRLVRRPAGGLPQVFGDQTDVPSRATGGTRPI